MAKSIKFNLIVDSKPIRTIEELQENFCINDIDELYKEGRLQKWLEVRGYNEYLAKVEKIQDEIPIYKLIDIFDMKSKISKEKVNEIVSNIYYENERKKQLEIWKKKDNDANSIIQSYHVKYDGLKDVMINNPSNFPLIKSTINEICKNYFGLFKINYKEFYFQIYHNVPLIVYACLMNDKSRELFLDYDYYNLSKKQNNSSEKQTEYVDLLIGAGLLAGVALQNNHNEYKKPKMFSSDVDDLLKNKSSISRSVIENFSGTFDIVNNCENKADIEKYILHIKGSTGGYWDEKEPFNQKVMILNMSGSAEVNSANKKDSGLKWNDVREFKILDGLQYRAKNDNDFIFYMLVD